MIHYDFEPSVYEANGDGSYTYRWNIQQETITEEGEENVIKWSCNEVIVWGTVTSAKLTEAVINMLWPKDYEQKLVNEYNSALMGIFGDPSGEAAVAKIAAYRSFLNERNEMKSQIDVDCETYNIR